MDSKFRKILCIPDNGTVIFHDVLDVSIVGVGVVDRVKELEGVVLDLSVDCFVVLEKCQMLLLFAWQHLNTGKWKDVNANWHKLYAAVSWMKAVATVRTRMQGEGKEEGNKPNWHIWQEVIRICDMGHLMGGDIKEGILLNTISNIEQSRLAADSESTLEQPLLMLKKPRLSDENYPTITHPLVSVVLPTLREFRQNYFLKKIPAILHGTIDDWPALSKWSPEYVRRVCGSRTVPVELGKRYTDEDWAQQLMTVGHFIDKYIYMQNNPDRKLAYLAQHDLLSQAPILRQDIHIPDYIAFCGTGDAEPDMNAWFGPEPCPRCTHDPKHNLLCQVVGEKYVRIYEEGESEKLYAHESGMLSNTSQLDVENPHLVAFPRFAEAVFQEHILKPGQVLYMPPKCWHYIRSLSISFSVSFWFE